MDFLEDNDENDLNDISELLDMTPTRRLFLKRPNWFAKLGDAEFRSRFRINKAEVLYLAERLNEVLGPRTVRSTTVPTVTKILITLRFCATGIFQSVNGDLFELHQTTISRSVTATVRAIAGLAPDIIFMPRNAQEIRESKQRHMNMVQPRGIPNVIGLIDCTHIKIISPGGSNAERFRNRKGFFSVNVQAVGNSDLRLLDVVARWPGSSHDSQIFDNSSLKVRTVF